MNSHYSRKIIETSSQLAKLLPMLAKPIVFTNGCFDIVHVGHIHYLDAAAQLGGTVIVGINTDQSIQTLEKAPGRPINPLNDRAAMLAALESVSLVIPFDDPTPIALIELIRPDVLVKGGDYATSDVVGREIVLSYGGKVTVIPKKHEQSTTAIVEGIRKQ